MYDTVFAKGEGGCFDPIRGRHYRDCICEPGATKDGMDMLKQFLGREPNSDAFFRNLL